MFGLRSRPAQAVIEASLAGQAVEIVVIVPIKTVFLHVSSEMAADEIKAEDYPDLVRHLERQGYYLQVIS